MFVTTMLEATHVHVGKDMSWGQMEQLAPVHYYYHAYCYILNCCLLTVVAQDRGGHPPNNYFLSTPLPTVILLYTLFNFFLCFSDVDECFEGLFNCTGSEECENLAGSFRCLCPTRLNMIRVNGTCQCMYVLNLRQATGFFQLNFLCCFPI